MVKSINIRITALFLAVVLLLGSAPIPASADNADQLTAFAPLGLSVAVQPVALGTSRGDLNLPGELSATLRAAVDGGEASRLLPVEGWDSQPEYDGGSPGAYRFTPRLEKAWSLGASGSPLPPSITVFVSESAGTALREIVLDLEAASPAATAESNPVLAALEQAGPGDSGPFTAVLGRDAGLAVSISTTPTNTEDVLSLAVDQATAQFERELASPAALAYYERNGGALPRGWTLEMEYTATEDELVVEQVAFRFAAENLPVATFGLGQPADGIAITQTAPTSVSVSGGDTVTLNYGDVFSFDAELRRSGSAVGGEFDGDTMTYTVSSAGISEESTISGGKISGNLGALPVGDHIVQVKYSNINDATITITVTFTIRVQALPLTITAGGVTPGAVGGDLVTVSGADIAFADKNAGAGKSITISGVRLTLNGARSGVLRNSDTLGNYRIVFDSSIAGAHSTDAEVYPRVVEFFSNAVGRKNYDGTTNIAALDLTGLISNAVSGDDVSPTEGPLALTYSDVLPGARIPVVGGIALGGGDRNNYRLSDAYDLTNGKPVGASPALSQSYNAATTPLFGVINGVEIQPDPNGLLALLQNQVLTKYFDGSPVFPGAVGEQIGFVDAGGGTVTGPHAVITSAVAQNNPGGNAGDGQDVTVILSYDLTDYPQYTVSGGANGLVTASAMGNIEKAEVRLDPTRVTTLYVPAGSATSRIFNLGEVLSWDHTPANRPGALSGAAHTITTSNPADFFGSSNADFTVSADGRVSYTTSAGLAPGESASVDIIFKTQNYAVNLADNSYTVSYQFIVTDAAPIQVEGGFTKQYDGNPYVLDFDDIGFVCSSVVGGGPLSDSDKTTLKDYWNAGTLELHVNPAPAMTPPCGRRTPGNTPSR